MLVFGFGGGGDDLVKVSLSDGSTQTLSAGDGVDASLGLMLTPVWVGDARGIGVSGTLGVQGLVGGRFERRHLDREVPVHGGRPPAPAGRPQLAPLARGSSSTRISPNRSSTARIR